LFQGKYWCTVLRRSIASPPFAAIGRAGPADDPSAAYTAGAERLHVERAWSAMSSLASGCLMSPLAIR